MTLPSFCVTSKILTIHSSNQFNHCCYCHYYTITNFPLLFSVQFTGKMPKKSLAYITKNFLFFCIITLFVYYFKSLICTELFFDRYKLHLEFFSLKFFAQVDCPC
jgi:hypothetical protein